jgi:Fic family protein
MASHLHLQWEARHQGMSRLNRAGCAYDAYLPDPLGGWNMAIPADIAADIADAESAIKSLNDAGTQHVSLEGLARFLLRAESVGSSKIEGLSAASRRLAKAEVALALGGDPADRIAVEILGNIAAMESAIDLASEASEFCMEDLLSIHRTLMGRSSNPEFGGELRQEQNWIGGSSYNPCSAAFIPPPPEYLEELLADLIEYINGDAHSPLVQAAVAHAQFETLHPFADGNGRTGRALIHVVLRRRGLAPKFVPPISLILATWSDDYVTGLTNFRHLGERDSEERSAAAALWLRTFAAAAHRSCIDAGHYSEEIAKTNAEWRKAIGSVRAKSGTDLLLQILPGAPIVTVESASALIGRSKARTTDAINSLVKAGVLKQCNIGRKRDRVFEASRILDLFTGLERALASPSGDTLAAPPNREVPRSPTER